MKDLKDLFSEYLIWEPAQNRECYYVTKAYDENLCWLRMNDFPEEPLWTLSFNSVEVDFDDQPEIWTFTDDELYQ